MANTGQNTIFFDLVKKTPYGDKLGHLVLFGVLTLGLIVGAGFRGVQCGVIKLYYGALAVTLFAIVEEVSQAFIPSRTFDLGDLTMGLVGIVVASLAGNYLEKYRSH